jgi:hypothetical protein
MTGPTVTMYLIHAPIPHRHAGHYLGITKRESLVPRMLEHLKGEGCTLVQLFAQLAGITTAEELVERMVVATWQSTRTEERRYKKWKGLGQICPVCRAARGLGPYKPKGSLIDGPTQNAV